MAFDATDLVTFPIGTDDFRVAQRNSSDLDELINLIGRNSNLSELRKDLKAWYGRIK